MKFTIVKAAAYSGEDASDILVKTVPKTFAKLTKPSTTTFALSVEYHLSLFSRYLACIVSTQCLSCSGPESCKAASFSFSPSFEKYMSLTWMQLAPATRVLLLIMSIYILLWGHQHWRLTLEAETTQNFSPLVLRDSSTSLGAPEPASWKDRP